MPCSQGPEVYTEDHTHGTTFDWFCTGVTLHEFLTGRRPFEAPRLQKYYSNPTKDTLELEFIYRLHLSKNCLDFITKLLQPQVRRNPLTFLTLLIPCVKRNIFD